MTLRIEVVSGEEMLEQWRYVHNLIVPPAALEPDDVRERAGRNRLENAYLDGVLVGCSTVRPPVRDGGTATVIARVLPEFRGQGIGTSLYEHVLAHALALGAKVTETVVLAANHDGLRLAARSGFDEIERYVVDGHEWVTLRLRDEFASCAGRGPGT